MPTAYPTNFMGVYYLGDNIDENLDALRLIWNLQHEHAEAESARRRLRKPVIVYCGAVAEAVLFDLFSKVRDFVREGVESIEAELAERLRAMNNDNFQFFIDQCRKHQLFGDGSDGFYDDLDKLAELRNRIHIQYVRGYKLLREREAFSRAHQKMAERTLENVIARMNGRYNRK